MLAIIGAMGVGLAGDLRILAASADARALMIAG
jgi:hypothetical protein